MTIQKVLDALHYEGGKTSGERQCNCPAHDDNRASLSVTEGKNGGVVLKCFAGCKVDTILPAAGLVMADIMPPETKPTKRAIVATYDYRDETGRLDYQAVRYNPKGFSQRRPDGKGGWINNMEGVTRVPYRLRSLLNWPATEWIFIPEGEKDCDNLDDVGIVATTNVGGAGKWQSSYNKHFAGKRVCILPDNDDPGRKHALEVAAQLKPIAARVKVVKLAGLDPKGDVTDWLNNGGTAAKLIDLANDAPEWEPGNDTQNAAEDNGREQAPGKAQAIRDALADMGHLFRLNEVRERIERADGSPLHDGEQATIVTDLFDLGFTNKALMQDVIMSDAWKNRYDPLRDFLNSLVWDGQDHIRKLSYYFDDKHAVIEYPDGSKSTVFLAWLRRWLVGAVAKVVGKAQPPMLVIVGEQGIGKSGFPRWLCSSLPNYFVESAINPESVDHQRWAAGNFIWEVGELGATTRKADVEALKAFITRHEHTFRVPYAKNEVHKSARVSFIGTVNPDNAGFLVDSTGNRRFLTVEVTAIHWRGYVADIDVKQVWAQAYALYKQNPDAWQLDDTEISVRDNINNEFNIDDPVADAIVSLFQITPGAKAADGLPFTSGAEVRERIESKVKVASTKALEMDISRAMKRLNVTKVKRNNVNGYYGVSRKPSSLLPTSDE